MSQVDDARRAGKYLIDPYLDWAKAQGAPIVEGQSIDLAAVASAPFRRFGADGAICHAQGRCDFLTLFVFDIPAGASMAPARHVYEEIFYVVSGAGRTRVTLSDGRERAIEWRQGAMFAAPVNATCVHEAAQGAPARLASFNDMRYLIGLYRNEAFLFDNATPFAARQDKAFAAAWSTQATEAALVPGPEGASADLALADAAIGVTLVELAQGEATLARRQLQGRHLLCVAGEGFTLSFDGPDAPVSRLDWRAGSVVGLESMRFHQHFGASSAARFATIELGSMSSPIFRSRRAAYGDARVYASGAAVVPREEERAEIAALRRPGA